MVYRRRRDTKTEKAPAPINRLRELREERGWSQQDVADFLHLDKSQISKLESGSRRLTEETIEVYARLFQIPPLAIFHHVYSDGEIGDVGEGDSGDT